jgi:hypothetical protein|tara:strand:+ start:538 stop:729 length:192 start_codon:yes stop_codon:yes gene_type:complete
MRSGCAPAAAVQNLELRKQNEECNDVFADWLFYFWWHRMASTRPPFMQGWFLQGGKDYSVQSL